MARPNNPKRGSGRPKKGLATIAEEQGYTPSEFSMLQLKENAELLRRWQLELMRGRIPDEMSQLLGFADGSEKGLSRAVAFVREEIKDLIEEERRWAPFFYPTMSSVESDVSMEGEISLLDVLRSQQTHQPGSDPDIEELD